MLSDLEIAQKIALRPITANAADLGLDEEDLCPCGRYQAKVNLSVDLSVLDHLSDRPNGKYVDVTALAPTPLGEAIFIPYPLAV